MKRLNYLLAFLVLGMILYNCKKEEEKADKNFFCDAKPKGWQCEFISFSDNKLNIPGYPDSALFVVKFTQPDSTFLHHNNLVHPQLILYIYPIEKQEVLSYLISQQQQGSWCIPFYYGMKNPYYVVTSPCYINYGNYTEEANVQIGPLHKALKSKLSNFNSSIY